MGIHVNKYEIKQNLLKTPNKLENDRKSITDNRSHQKISLLTHRQKYLRVESARKHTIAYMKKVIFTDETRATIDGPDGWAIGRVHARE